MIQYYSNQQVGAPTWSNTSGNAITVLDAVLVNGYNQVNVASITRNGTTATITTSVTHGLDAYSICEIAGATQTEYNGKFYISSIVGLSSFTYQITGTPAITATGTITCKRASAGWNKIYSLGSKTVYQANSGLKHYYLVDGLSVYWTSVRGAEDITFNASKTEILSFTNQFPNTVQGSIMMVGLDSVNSATYWGILASDTTVYVFTTNSGNGKLGNSVFGEFTSYKFNDKYNSVVSGSGAGGQAIGNTNCGYGPAFLDAFGNGAGAYVYLCRNVNGSITGSTLALFGSDTWRLNQNVVLAGPSSFYNTNGGYNFAPIWIGERSNGIRGHLPGVWACLHSDGTFKNYSILKMPDGSPLAGKTFFMLSTPFNNTGNYFSGSSGMMALEISPTWDDHL